MIHLFSGSDSTEFQQYRENLKVFLKGSKAKKELLRTNQPHVYNIFEKIWTLRSNHMVIGYPPQYVFFLVPCFKESCCHPVCQKSVGSSADKLQWYPGGPPLNSLPMPHIDPERPWGNEHCTDCKGMCNGNYVESSDESYTPPPSVTLQKAFNSTSTLDPEQLAEAVCLPEAEVEIWLKHLQTVKDNRKLGAKKRKRKRSCTAVRYVEMFMKKKQNKLKIGLHVMCVTVGFTGNV